MTPYRSGLVNIAKLLIWSLIGQESGLVNIVKHWYFEMTPYRSDSPWLTFWPYLSWSVVFHSTRDWRSSFPHIWSASLGSSPAYPTCYPGCDVSDPGNTAQMFSTNLHTQSNIINIYIGWSNLMPVFFRENTKFITGQYFYESYHLHFKWPWMNLWSTTDKADNHESRALNLNTHVQYELLNIRLRIITRDYYFRDSLWPNLIMIPRPHYWEYNQLSSELYILKIRPEISSCEARLWIYFFV